MALAEGRVRFAGGVLRLAWWAVTWPLYAMALGLVWVFDPRGNPARLLGLVAGLLLLSTPDRRDALTGRRDT
jgi:hypothetical protein